MLSGECDAFAPLVKSPNVVVISRRREAGAPKENHFLFATLFGTPFPEAVAFPDKETL